MEAVRHIPLEDREAFKYALAATLVKSQGHWRAFETVFEVYFSLRGREFGISDDEGDGEPSQQAPPEGDGSAAGGAMDGLTPEQLAPPAALPSPSGGACCEGS